jgi:hypothetical protein
VDWWIYCFWFFIVLATSFVVADHFKKRKGKKLHVEFKCLEHMQPLDQWSEEWYQWECPHPGCEAFVDAEIRWKYEGIKPPSP